MLSQGDLAPPGAPAPTMKTLEQIEPRTPISSLPFTITEPGSYYVTTNLTGNPGGITIAASGVTLDLMGFELVGGTGDGIFVSGARTNIVVRNGTVRGWSATGVDGASADGSQFTALRASDNFVSGIAGGRGSVISGCTAQDNGGNGIVAGQGSAVTGCAARENSGAGISVGAGSTVRGCAAESNTGTGIVAGTGCTVSDCAANANDGDGFSTTGASTIRGCTAQSNGDDGFDAGTGSTVADCTARSNSGDGILVSSACLVLNNACDLNGFNGDGAGVHAIGSSNRIDGNNVTNNDRGLDVDVGGNLIIRNSARGNGFNYSQVAAGNTRGELVDTTGVGGTVDETHSAWANFSF